LIAREASLEFRHEDILQPVSFEHEVPESFGSVLFNRAKDVCPFLMVAVQPQIFDANIAVNAISRPNYNVLGTVLLLYFVAADKVEKGSE
jgi:hypothetical protein